MKKSMLGITVGKNKNYGQICLVALYSCNFKFFCCWKRKML